MLSICFNCCIKLSKHKKNQERISKIKPFIDQYNWKEIEFPSNKKDWEKFELNTLSVLIFACTNLREFRELWPNSRN